MGPWRFALPTVLCASFALAVAAQAACDIPPTARLTPPTVDGKPVKVQIDVTLIDVITIEDADQLFTADLIFSEAWRDPRLSAAALGKSLEGCLIGPDEVWHSDFGSVNRRALTFVFGPRGTVDSEGGVHFESRVFGDFSSRLDLREFPFDGQDLVVRAASLKYGPQDVELVGQTKALSSSHIYSLTGWTVVGQFVDNDVTPARVGSETFSRLDYVIQVRRNAGYYVWNFVVPLCFIVLMAWTVFWLDPQALGVQIGISTASAFTLVAFLVALRGRLPPVPYLTRMDKLILYSTVLVFVALAQAVLTSRLAQVDKLPLARRIDSYGRWIYLAAFGLVLYATLLR